MTKQCGLCGWSTDDDGPGCCQRCGQDWWGYPPPSYGWPWGLITVGLVLGAGFVASLGMGLF